VKTKTLFKKRNNRIASGFNRILLYEFDALDEHRSFAERSLNASIKALDERVNKEIGTLNEEDCEAYQDVLNEEYIAMHEVLPRIQWNSQFLFVYSTFEHMLNELCRIVKRRSGFDLSYKDISGQGIERSKNYLSKVAGVKAPFQSQSWNRAKLLAEIRNAISHKNGEIELNIKNQSCLGSRLSREKNLTLKKVIPDQENAQITLSNEFVRNAISELREVLVSICNYELYDDKS